MHISSLENMDRALAYYAPTTTGRVIDIGAMNVNGSYRELFDKSVNYVGLDLEAGPGVDVVLDDPYKLPFDDESVDLVISGQMLEHCAFFWKTFEEIARVLSPNGICIMIAPSAGPAHYKVDYYRFYADAWSAIADWCGLRVVDNWIDERGEWHDNVAVFQKGYKTNKKLYPIKRDSKFNASRSLSATTDSITVVKETDKRVKDILNSLQVNEYLQIGNGLNDVRLHGRGTFISEHSNIFPLVDVANYYRCSSSDFFHFSSKETFGKFDVAYIRGKRFFDDIYRDFICVERLMKSSGVIIIDSIYDKRESEELDFNEGTGYKFLDILKSLRKTLEVNIDFQKSCGLISITNLEPNNAVLAEKYNSVVMRMLK